MMSIIEQIVKTLETLPAEEQQRVLGYVEGLAAGHRRPAVAKPGAGLLKHIGSFDPAMLDRIEAAIEEGCEGVDLDEW
jgi:hypothetical protein